MRGDGAARLKKQNPSGRVFLQLLAASMLVATLVVPGGFSYAAHPLAAPGVTSLTNPEVTYHATEQHRRDFPPC